MKTHELVIVNYSNWIVCSIDGSADRKSNIAALLSAGYEISKRKDGDHYAVLHSIGSEFSVDNFWLRKL